MSDVFLFLCSRAACVLVAALATRGLIGCGQTAHERSGDTEAPSGGSSGTIGTGNGGSSGAPKSGTDRSAIDVQALCSEPQGKLGSCLAKTTCLEPTSDLAASVSRAICLPGLGLTPRTMPCPAADVIARCYETQDERWTYLYASSDDLASARARCSSEAQVFCPGLPPGINDYQAACKTACDAARPDFGRTPECAQLDTCVQDCQQASAGLNDNCARCILENITWSAGGCNDFECVCEPPRFAKPDSQTCSPACER